MRLTPRTRRQLQLNNWLYALLLLAAAGLLGWLSMRYSLEADWTAGNRNTLDPSSVEMLKQFEQPLTVTVFVGDNDPAREHITSLVDRYRQHKHDITLNFVNPDTNPAQTRAMGVTRAGELVIEYQGQQERLQQLSEETFTNALQRLARQEERWAIFLTGHGERNARGQENFSLAGFTEQLDNQGFRVQSHNLLENPDIPANTHVLVIAGPQTDYLPGEVKMVRQYVDNGGNLLWLAEPGGLHGLEPLARQLGIGFLPGTVVDEASQMLGLSQPDFALVINYQQTPITDNMSQPTLFPQAAGLESRDDNPLGLFGQPFLQTLPRSWTETGGTGGNPQFNPGSGERRGPITLGMYMTRSVKNGDGAGEQQRIVVTGDGDFLSNAFLGNGANLDLGLNIMNWLSRDDQFIDIQPISAPDTRLNLGETSLIAISAIFLLVLPLGLLITGGLIWLKRRKR